MTTITIPDNWLPTSENINALPRPVRDYIMRLHANTDPAGEIRRAMIAEMERDALRKMIEEAPEAQFYECFNPEDFTLASEIIDVFDASLAGKRAKILEVE